MQVADFLVAATTGGGPPVSAALQLWRLYDVEAPPPAEPLRHPKVSGAWRWDSGMRQGAAEEGRP